MEPAEIDKMHRLEETHWWFLGKRSIIRSVVGERDAAGGEFLDVGCGTGMFLRELGRHGIAYGVDASEQALSYCRLKGAERVVLADAGSLPFEDGKFSIVFLLDVIEHLDDDLGALSEAFRVCRAGGAVVVSVPAFGFLWGSHDVAHHHKRRYTRSGLRALSLRAGFRPERLTYTNFCIFLPVLIRRTVFGRSRNGSDLSEPSGAVNAVMKLIYRVEAGWLRRADFPFGVSLLAVLRKPG